MALIDSRGDPLTDPWRYPDQCDDSDPAHAVLPLDGFVARAVGSAAWRPAGVRVASDVPPDRLMPLLGRLDLVAVEFPKFRDGRGFSIARALRERFLFKGDVRAIGHILPDQLKALVQCGFSSILVPAEHEGETWRMRMGAEPLLHRTIGVGPHRGAG